MFFKRTKQFLVLGIACALVVSCSNEVEVQAPQLRKETSRMLLVQTARASEARCEITDGKNGQWMIESTPATIDVTNSSGALNATCYKSVYKPSAVEFKTYANEITIWMEPATWSSKQQMEVWHDAKEAYERNN